MARGSRWVPVLALVLSVGSGCAAFRQDKLPPIAGWPPAPGTKGTARVVVTGQVYENGNPLEGMGMVLDWWSNHVLAMYAESGLFSQVQLGRGAADHFIEVDIQQRLDASTALAVLTGLTLTLVPSVTHTHIDVKTTITNADGDRLGTVTKTEEVNTWIQLFMIFPMITNFPSRVIFSTLDDLNRASIIEAHQRGYF